MPIRNNTIQPLSSQCPEVGRWLWTMQDARSRTYETLEGISQAELEWSPDPQASTTGSLLYHIAAIEASWLYDDVLQTDLPGELVSLFPQDVRDQSGLLVAVRGETLESHLRRLDAVRARLVLVYAQFTLPEFLRPRFLPYYEVSPEWTLHHLLQHEAEHRGQIGLLRELYAHR
jgi:uncharacterized damage-inducible protein DinB